MNKYESHRKMCMIYIYIYLDSAMKRLLEIILNLMIMKIAKVILLFLILFSIVQKGKSFGLCYIFVCFPDYNKERTWVWPVSTGMIIPQWQINYLEKVYLKNKSLVCVCVIFGFSRLRQRARASVAGQQMMIIPPWKIYY